MKLHLFVAISALILWSKPYAAPTPLMCLQGNSSNNEFAKTLQSQKPGSTSLMTAYSSHLAQEQAELFWTRLGKNPVPFLKDTHASHKNCMMEHDYVTDYQKILHAIEVPSVKMQCLNAALKRTVPGGNNYCSSDSAAPPSKTYASNTVGQCITDEIAKYYQWALRQAYSCIAYESSGPLDLKLIFRIFNNESGFSMFQKATGGMGIGQLTTDAISDMSKEKVPGVFDRIARSNRKECKPFQQALKEHRPKTSSEICHFQNPNQGLARQLIYSIGYLVRTRDGLMNIPQKLNEVGIEDIRYANLILAIRYSAEASKAPALLSHLLKNPKMSLADFTKYVESKTKYADDMKRSFASMQQIDPSLTTIEDCIEY